MAKQIRDYWGPETRIIELGVRTPTLGDAFLRSDRTRYLGVAHTDQDLGNVAAQSPGLGKRLTVWKCPKLVRKNNAQVLVLQGANCKHIGHFHSIRHANYVALALRPSVNLIVGTLLGLVQCLLGRLAVPVIIRCGERGETAPRLVVFRNRRPWSNPFARCYIPHAIGVEGFLKRLLEQRVRCAVLRWFEELPVVAAGEDLDMLVEDAGLEAMRALMDSGPGVQPVDLYSVSGLPGSNFRGMPYYPPHLARQMLDQACVRKGLFLAPCESDHFLSLAYHAVYHKGTASGLLIADTKEPQGSRPDHDYAAVLQEMAKQQQVDVEPTLDGFERFLDSVGWRPSYDMIVRLSRKHAWLRPLLTQMVSGSLGRGLAVFLVRRKALQCGGVDEVVRWLGRDGFHIEAQKHLSLDESRSVAKFLRKRSGTKGQLADSEGHPAVAIVAYDTIPQPLGWRQRMSHPGVSNARLLVRKRLCKALNRRLAQRKRDNIVQCSRNGQEAIALLRITMPDAIDDILRHVKSLQETFLTSEPVLADLTRYGRRAKVEVVEQDGDAVVRKTFKRHQQRFCQREVRAMTELSRVVKEVPPVLRADQLSFTMPYYDNVMRYQRSSGKLLPLSIAVAAIEAFRKVHQAGWAHMDANIDNLIIDRREGLKLIDFEFSHRYDQKPASFELGYDIAGCPDGFSHDIPSGIIRSYDHSWRPYIGLSLDSLLGDPRWLQTVKRAAYYVAHAPRFLPRRIRYYFRSLAAASSYLTRRETNPADSAGAMRHGGDTHARPSRRAA